MGGLIVSLEFSKNPNFNAADVGNIKNISTKGFANGGHSTTYIISNTEYILPNISGVVENSTVFVSGNGHLTFYGDGLTNYTITNGSVNIQKSHDNNEYSVPEGGLETLDIHITGWADTKIHNIQSIKNLDLKVTGTGNSDMNTILNNITINYANIVNYGGGATSNIYIINSYINKSDVHLAGGVDSKGNVNYEANLFIINSTIEDFEYRLDGSANIHIFNSTIDNEYIVEKTMGKN